MNKRKDTKSKLTDHALAAAAGVAESTWRVHKQQGAPRPCNGADVVRWVDAYSAWRAERARRPGPAANRRSDLSNPKLSHWSTERMRWLAVRNRTAALREIGQLVSRDEVVEFAGKACHTVRTRLEQMVQKLGSRFGDQVMDAVEQEVDEILTSFSRSLDPADHGIQSPEGIAETGNTMRPHSPCTASLYDAETAADILADDHHVKDEPEMRAPRAHSRADCINDQGPDA